MRRLSPGQELFGSLVASKLAADRDAAQSKATAELDTLRAENAAKDARIALMVEALKACGLVLPVVAGLSRQLNDNFRKDVQFAIDGIEAALASKGTGYD
jgi:hypothetical protein